MMRLRGGLLAFGILSIPIWPAFISLAALTPPGVSIVPLWMVFADLALCITAAIVAGVLLVRERASLPPLLPYVAAYVGSWILASLLGLDPVTGLLMTLALVLATVFHVGIDAWYARPGVARTLLVTLLGSGSFVALLGIAMVALRRPVELYVMVHGRATSTFVVPGEFAGYLLLLIFTALGVALVASSPALRALAILALLSGFAALAATYSRAAWLGAIVGAVFLLRQCALRNVLLGLLVALPLVASAFNAHHNPSEDFARLPIWTAALRAIEMFPLTGVGPGAFRHVYPWLRPTTSEMHAFHGHNVLLTAFAETGIVGFAALLALWYRFAQRLKSEMASAASDEAGAAKRRTFALAIAAGLVATWAQGMFDFVQVLVLGCWLPFLSLALAAGRWGLPE